MKNILFILSACLLIACGGSKKIVQNTTKPNTQNTTVSEEKEPLIEETKEEVVKETPQQPEVIEEKPITVTEAFNHQSWDVLLQKHVTPEGNVSYKGFIKDKALLRTYLKSLENTTPAETWSKEDKLAYWMNVYNAFTIKLIINNYPVKSIKNIKDPWDLRFFKIGSKWYTLNDIEHRILRKMEDPRIHFGINCASFSCPPLLNKAFTAENVDQELEKLAITFINDPKRNTLTTDKVQLSKIFSWFSKDFKTEGSLIDFLNKYAKVTVNQNAQKSYKKYNWTLNE
ncbi:DUF547 domain-containing protein [Aquimarina sp. MMG016]|uniref:DUF547 domain-containing protein n=1 Tax=Aquimarina sp. MMG016 TaxID=2822690 RepID=UPI001B39E6F7|nr:DUF547 domain-containing protein [Aquimarina sp. MMG016]MBQ4820838.1 DUF547 domain-containing protein [Aquimarina sp. MMG016]